MMSFSEAHKAEILDRAAFYRRLYSEALADLESRWTPKGAGGEWSGQQRSMARAAARRAALERLQTSEVASA